LGVGGLAPPPNPQSPIPNPQSPMIYVKNLNNFDFKKILIKKVLII
jgi:hypothetical protein